MTSELIVKPAADLAVVFVDRLIGLISRARAEDRSLGVALPGGSVADAFLPVLAGAAMDWDRIEWFWGDERAVPPDHPESNFRLAAQLFFRKANINPAKVHRMKGEADDLETAASNYESALMTTLGIPPRFDVVLLGVGPDGHVCSLFPDHPALDASSFVVAVTDAPKPPARRLTLTLPALADAVVVIAAFGASKAFAIADALENRHSRLPVALAARGARHTIFLVDEQAASAMHA